MPVLLLDRTFSGAVDTKVESADGLSCRAVDGEVDGDLSEAFDKVLMELLLALTLNDAALGGIFRSDGGGGRMCLSRGFSLLLGPTAGD